MDHTVLSTIRCDEQADIGTHEHRYCEAWKSVVQECYNSLEPEDHHQALEIKTLQDFSNAFDQLKQAHPNAAPLHVTDLLCVALMQYERLARAFVRLAPGADVTPSWGLLHLVVKLAFESHGSLQGVASGVEELCHELRKLHAYAYTMQTGYDTLASDIYDISKDMIELWIRVIVLYRAVTVETRHGSTLDSILHAFTKAMRKIGNAVVRVEKLATIAERKADLEVIQRVLPPQHQQHAQLPCFAVPIAQNKKFFGRTDCLVRIDLNLRPGSSESTLRSYGLWAMGGMGKTQVALAYAYLQVANLGRPGHPDAVLWIPAFDRTAFLRGVSKIVVDDLKLPSAVPGADLENLILFQTWLAQTPAKWLLIFDNVDNHDILGEFWPACNRGSILITTRKRSIVTQPLDGGMELVKFSAQQGADMLRLLLNRGKSHCEDQAALDISDLLSGHALALNQMSAYMAYNNLKFTDFRTHYREAPQKLHREKKPGSTHVGYDHSLDTVWQLSFEKLTPKATRMLAFLSYLSSSPVSSQLFDGCHEILIARKDDFYKSRRALLKAKSQLVDYALVGEDDETNHLTLHLLVQEAALSKISPVERQKAFNDAVKLVRNKFFDRGSTPRADLWPSGLPFLSHIYALAEHWKNSQERKDSLQAPVDLCYLICSASIFIMDNDPFGMRHRLAKIAKAAYETLPNDSKSEELWADILIDLQYAVLRLGDFRTALDHARGIDGISGAVDPNDKFAVASAHNRYGLALDSGGRHDEAQAVLKAAIDVLTGDEEEVHRSQWRMHLNYARNRYSVKDFEPAEQHCKLSEEAAKKLKFSWDVWAWIHETTASLYLRAGRYVEAKEQSDRALSILEAAGVVATTSSLAAICAYRAAQVAIAQRRVKDAIEQAQRARTLDRSCKAPITTLARSTRLLFRAYSLDPNRREQAMQIKEEAHLLRKLLPDGRTDMNDDSDEAYEALVDIMQR